MRHTGRRDNDVIVDVATPGGVVLIGALHLVVYGSPLRKCTGCCTNNCTAHGYTDHNVVQRTGEA
jgi:hypothetical protein